MLGLCLQEIDVNEVLTHIISISTISHLTNLLLLNAYNCIFFTVINLKSCFLKQNSVMIKNVKLFVFYSVPVKNTMQSCPFSFSYSFLLDTLVFLI